MIENVVCGGRKGKVTCGCEIQLDGTQTKLNEINVDHSQVRSKICFGA